MMERKLSRALAAALALAMAFSVLAVPASAATDAEVAEAKAATGLAVKETIWGDQVNHITPRAYCTDGDKNLATDNDVWADYVLEQCSDTTKTTTMWEEAIPTGAVEGYEYVGTPQVIWLSAEDQAKVEAAKAANPDAEMKLDWNTGKVKVGETAISTITSRSAPTEAQAKAAKAIISEAMYDEALGCEIREILTKEYVLLSADEEKWAKAVQVNCLWGGYSIYTGTIPAGALQGCQKADTKQVVWFDEDDLNKIDALNGYITSINWSTGVVTVGDTEVETLTTRLNAAKSNNTGDNGNGGSSGAALLAVGGVVVAAGVATAVYFATNPAAWQKIVNTLRGAQELPTNATPAAENGEAPATAETEEAAETASPAEATAAA